MKTKTQSIDDLILEHYGLRGSVTRLNSYIDLNFLVDTGKSKWVLKLNTPQTSSEEFLEAQNKVLSYLKENKLSLQFPELQPLQSGEDMRKISWNRNDYFMRLFSFVSGEFFHLTHPDNKFHDLGASLGQLDKALLDFRSTAIESRYLRWDINHALDARDYLHEIEDAHNRSIVDYFLLQFEIEILPLLRKFRKSIIHADANEANILISGDKVSGLIDFGDMVYSQTVNELAIAVTYAILDQPDSLGVAKKIIEGYHNVLPLTENEVDILHYLIAARLCISVCMSAHAKTIDPTNEYISVSEAPAWRMLHRLLEINPIAASNAFREVCGLPKKTPKNLSVSLEKRKAYLSSTLSLSYDEPIHMHQAAFQYMYDTSGKTYLDAYNNIPHVGHSHPHVAKAGMKQMARLNTNTRYIYEELNEYAERLLTKFPASLNKIFFVNSGSAASDLAIRLAQIKTKRKDLLVMEHGYHGNTQTGIEISAYKFLGKGGAGKPDNVHVADIPDTYRGKFRGENAGDQYVNEVKRSLEEITKQKQLAAFIAEPIVGCGGQVVLPLGYLKSLYALVREQGGLCISDEVQTGFGRVGSTFWGFELHDVIPDIVILGKPMGNAHPIGAVVTTTEVADAFNTGMEFFSSFGGNPVSCAIGLAVLDVIENENLQQNARAVGNYLMDGFRKISQRFTIIGDVRGSGLFIGVEIIRNQQTLEPATEEAKKIINNMKEKGILMSTDGPFNNVIKMKPPLCLTISNADVILATFEQVLNDLNT